MRILLLLVAIICPLLLLADEHDYHYVDIDGNRLAYLCKGVGDLTALLIAGMGLDAHSTYKNTFHNAKPEDYQLCFYDRAGTGNSSFAKQKARSITELAEELTAFTQKTNMNHLILVPHSFGGFVARAFAHKNPEKVEAIIFVDSAHESWYEDMKKSMSMSAWETMSEIMEWEKNSHSYEDFEEASSQADIYELKGKYPIVVMSRGIPHVSIRQTGMSYSDVDAYNSSWNRSQEKLRALLPNSKSVVMEYASHLFDETDPWIVIKEIDEMAASITAELNKPMKKTANASVD